MRDNKTIIHSICISFCWVSAIALFLNLAGCQSTEKHAPPNVLFIAVDDLRPELNCYGVEKIKTPHMDKLAAEGILFERAYAQQPICMASRASLLTGLYPDQHRIYSCLSVEELVPDYTTLNEQFSGHGYQVFGIGKIYHHQQDHQVQFGDQWISENPNPEARGRDYLSPESHTQMLENGRGPAFENPEVPDEAYRDGYYAKIAIRKLKEFKESEKPFFLALGFHKPHLPFNAPKKYWDLYPDESFNLPANDSLPANATRFTPFDSYELRNYTNIPGRGEPIPDSLGKMLVHGYYASVSYVDAQIGKVLTALKEYGLDENTLVVLWGDHGWKLGEHDMWGKHTNFEIDVRVPLLMKAPGIIDGGSRSKAYVELVDLYPTLCQLSGIPVPAHVKGQSFLPLLKNSNALFRKNIYSLWPSYAGKRTDPESAIIGYAVQDDRYRYIEWTRVKNDSVLAVEMYDHQLDPAENVNVAPMPKYKQVLKLMKEQLESRKHN